MAEQLLNQDGNRILTPMQMKKQECKIQINKICAAYGMQLIPIFQIAGTQIISSVELSEVVAPTGATIPDPGGK